MEAAHNMFTKGFLKDTSFILKSRGVIVVFIGNRQMKLQYINITFENMQRGN